MKPATDFPCLFHSTNSRWKIGFKFHSWCGTYKYQLLLFFRPKVPIWFGIYSYKWFQFWTQCIRNSNQIKIKSPIPTGIISCKTHDMKCKMPTHATKKIWHIFAMIIVFCVFRFVFLYFVNYILNWIKRYCKNQANTIIDLHSVFIL